MIRIVILVLSTFLTTSLFAQNEFAFNFYNTLEKEKNLFFSPTSIKAAFAMAYEGANGQTQKEFEDVFQFEENNLAFLNELRQLKESAEISNSIWILDDYEVLKSYTDSMKSQFDAAPNFTDFRNDPKGSADKINKWIEESTNGMIKKMLDPDQVQDFKMSLVNAVYFKQSWKTPFNKKRTAEKDFTNFDKSKSKVDMMHATEHYLAYDGSSEKVVELPYKDERTSMIIVLPKNMKDYKMDQQVYDRISGQLTWQKVNLELPKFTFETPTFELKNSLVTLGLKQAFGNSANFTGMRKQKDIKIGTALHKAKVIVNEEGTEAAAVTVIGMVKTTSMAPRPTPIMQLKVDKPFYYFIKDKTTGAILFMGVMNKMP